MIYVIDASVAAKWFLLENLRDRALHLLDRPFQRLAPDWIIQEIAQVAFKKWRDGDIEPEQARAMAQALPSFMTQLLPASDLTERALAIAMTIRHPVYDCLYIACAEVGEGTLVTADQRLCAVVRDTAFGHLVQHLSDLAL